MPQAPAQLETKLGRYMARRERLLAGLRLIPQIGEAVMVKAFAAGFDLSSDKSAVLESLSSGVSITKGELHGALGAASMLLGIALPKEEREDYQDVLRDLAKAHLLDKDAAHRVSAILQGIAADEAVLRNLNSTFRAEEAMRGIFPSLLSVNSACVLVPCLDPEYKPGIALEEYRPKVAEPPIPAVALQMDIDVFGTTKEFSFAVSAAELQKLVSQLQAAEKELAALESWLQRRRGK